MGIGKSGPFLIVLHLRAFFVLGYPGVRWHPDTTVQPPRVRKLYRPTGHELVDLHLSAPKCCLGSGDPLFMPLTEWPIVPLVRSCSGDIKQLYSACACRPRRGTCLLRNFHILPSHSNNVPLELVRRDAGKASVH
jgi:hypothetical protein